MGWMRIDRVTWAERGLWATLVLATAAPVLLKPSPEEVAAAWVEAVNREDVDAALALTGEEFILRPVLGGYFQRAEEARPVLEWRAALNERWRIDSWEYNPEDREVHAGIEITNDAWSLAGTRPTIEVVLVVRNGRLVTEQFRKGGKELERALEPFLDWAAAERPRELSRAWHRRAPLPRADAAGRLLELLRAWRAAEVAEDSARGQA